MAKKSKIARYNRQLKLIEQYADLRRELKAKVFITQKAGMSPAFLVNNSKYRNNYPQLNVENQQVNLTIQLLENQIFGKSAEQPQNLVVVPRKIAFFCSFWQ